MDLSKLSEPLEIHQIDFRVQSINKGGYATILAYKDARVDMQRLDDVCGPLGWKREHLNGNHNCIVSVWNDATKQWVGKEDTGTESNTEAQKGLASDSFKRACFNWGIGRELYDYPVIQVKLNPEEFNVEGTRAKATWKLKLKEWVWCSQWEEGKLTYLAAKCGGKLRFSHGEHNACESMPQEADPFTPEQKDKFIGLLSEADGFALKRFAHTVGNDVMSELFNAAPQGQKTKQKEMVRGFVNDANTQLKTALAAIQEAINDGDYSAIEEIYGEMGQDESFFVDAGLSEIQQHSIETMREAA